MIPRFFSIIATYTFPFLFSVVAGLLASPIAGCTVAPKATSNTNHNRVVTVASDIVTSTKPTTSEINSVAPKPHPSYYLSNKQRIKALKEAQLLAQSNKIAYSGTGLKPQRESHNSQEVATSEQPSTKLAQYTVGQGENLYLIAAKASIYNDGLLWPLIYKSNRDQIKDPEQIFPGQKLTINHTHSKSEKEKARETARNSGIFIH